MGAINHINCPVCGSVGTLRVEGTGKPPKSRRLRRPEHHRCLFCVRRFAEDPLRTCGFQFFSSIAFPARSRILLMGPSSDGEKAWGATMSRGLDVSARSGDVGFHFIITARREQLNATEIALPPFGEIPDSPREVPTAVRGYRNCVPLVMACSHARRWLRKRFLTIVSPWIWERQLWHLISDHPIKGSKYAPGVGGLVLVVELDRGLQHQLDCLEELRTSLHLIAPGSRKRMDRAPTAVVLVGSQPGEAQPIPRTVREDVESRIASLTGGEISWFIPAAEAVWPLGWGNPKRTMTAIHLEEALTWILAPNSKKAESR